MDRLACVELPALPLQLLLRANPASAKGPAAVVESERPQAEILWINRAARKAGVTRRMRAGSARALAPELFTGVIEPYVVEAAVEEILVLLRKFSARVEPAKSIDRAGQFFLDASGLLQIFPSLEIWGEQLQAALVAAGLLSGVAVGFARFHCAAVAKACGVRLTVFASPDEEEAASARVPLSRAGLPEETLSALEQLGVQTIGQFLELPLGGILRRFGPEALRLRRLAAGELDPPLAPLAINEPLELSLELDDAEIDRTRLTFLGKQLLDALLGKLAARYEAAAELKISLVLKQLSLAAREKTGDVTYLEELLRPAEPTLDAAQLLGLLRLRLETMALPSGVTRISLAVKSAPATQAQLEMHAQKPKRDLDAAARAFARLRALFGEHAVTRAKIEKGHLPEARFSWEPLTELLPANPNRELHPKLVRRIHQKALLLPPRESREPDGWLICGLSGGRVEKLDGPHRISGGWWQSELERDYYFAETSLGELLWIFYDRKRRRWLLQGAVV
jgi:protein ImuB